jgi:lipid II:glycine glycyltransferase (peptidoglycan interpeptide bridge formation enzyme)
MDNLNQIATHPLQTRAWGEFRRQWGNEVLETKFGILTLHPIPFTPYKIGMFIKGPMPTKEQLLELRTLGKEKNLIFIKLEPNYVVKKGGISCADEKKVISLLKKYGAVPGKTLFTPTTFWIDLTKSEEELLKSFHSKTRYNIKYAQKHNVTVGEDNSPEAFETYLKLLRETVERQRFYAHNEKYHRLMWQILEPAGIAKLLVAKYQNEIIATWIVFVWKDFLYYPYGASSSNPAHYRLMPSALLMWEAIRLGKVSGCKTFDLWGREEGKGFTRFKEGFNPQVIEFLGTWDLVINKPAYKLYKSMDFARWIFLKGKSKFTKPSF